MSNEPKSNVERMTALLDRIYESATPCDCDYCKDASEVYEAPEWLIMRMLCDSISIAIKPLDADQFVGTALQAASDWWVKWCDFAVTPNGLFFTEEAKAILTAVLPQVSEALAKQMFRAMVAADAAYKLTAVDQKAQRDSQDN